MKVAWIKIALVLGGLSVCSSATPAQTTVAASLYGAFQGSTSGNNTQQSPANAAGGLFELRHITNPLVGFEVTYAYNRANQGLSNLSPYTPGCPVFDCSSYTSTAAISANAHEITGDWLASLKVATLRPFVLAGGGLLLTVPSAGTITTITTPVCTTACPALSAATTTTASTRTSTQGVFVYGAGVDWTVLPHLGLRLQYRGNLYKAPDVATAFHSTNAFTHSAEPMIGIFFQF